jgi:hypothetical protein
MRASMPMSIAIASMLAAIGCAKPGQYVCAIDLDCGADGFCEAGGLCSATDSECPSGRRYGELAGSRANDCVDDEPPITVDETALCGVTAARPDGTGTCAQMVCAADSSCCETSWDQQCARIAEARCDLDCEEIIAAGGYSFSSVFRLDAPRTMLWSQNYNRWNYTPAWGDIDGDGNPDLAYAREGSLPTSPGVVILESSGLSGDTLTLTPASIGGDPISWVENILWRDFDADGDLDLLASGMNGIWLVVTDNHTYTAHQLSTTMYASATWVSSSSAPPWKIAASYGGATPRVVIETFDETYNVTGSQMIGDSNDNAIWCHVGGTPARDLIVGDDIYLANATGFAAPTQASGDGFFPTCADLDADGDNDLVLGDYDSVKIILNQNGLTTPPIEFTTLAIGGITVADFDNNGRLDVLASTSTNMRTEIPLYFFDHLETGFAPRDILPDWNTADLDSQGVDVGRPPVAPR